MVSFTPRPLYPRGKELLVPVVGPRADLGKVVMKKILIPYRDSNRRSSRHCEKLEIISLRKQEEEEEEEEEDGSKQFEYW